MFVLYRAVLVFSFLVLGTLSLHTEEMVRLDYRGAVLSHVHEPGRGYGTDHHKIYYPHLKNIGYDTVQLNTFAFVNHRHYTSFVPENDPTMSLENIESEIKDLKSVGFKVMLKPHVWIAWWNFDQQSWNKLGYNQDPRNQIHFDDPNMRAKWFSNYSEFILSQAELAERCGVDMFVVGSELRKMSRYTAEWIEIIGKVREVYSGKITYAAEGVNVFNIEFWDSLDYIGVDAYFSVSKTAETTITNLLEGWSQYENGLRKLSRKYGKKIVITEIGYKSVESTANKPWKWEINGKVSQEEQALAYKALSLTFENKPYLAGVFVWKYYADRKSYDEDYIKYDFTPYKKEAERVISGWFKNNEG